jgi:archaellum component FlaC
MAKFEGQNERFASIDKRLGGLHEDIREIRSDVKLLTGKVYEMMAQKG